MAKSVTIRLEETVARLLAGSATIGNALMEVVPKIEAIMSAHNETLERTMQPAVVQIVKLCLDAGLAVKKNIHGRNCGIHPSNRAGTGVDPFNAQELLVKISQQGYSEKKLENPMGFEKAELPELQKKQNEFMKRNFEQAGGLLKEIPYNDIEYLSITCSHTFAACNLLGGGVKDLAAELCDIGMMIDPHKVRNHCPSRKKQMEEGIPCIVFRRELEEACPELPNFLSQAGNQSHDVHSKETKLQLMICLHQFFVQTMIMMTSKSSIEGKQ